MLYSAAGGGGARGFAGGVAVDGFGFAGGARLGALPAGGVVGRAGWGDEAAGGGAVGFGVEAARAERVCGAEVFVCAAERAFGFDDVNVVFREFIDEAGGDRRLVKAARAAVLSEADLGAFLGPRDADVGEAAFFLQTLDAAFIQRALVGEQTFLEARQEDRVELQALGGVECHERHALAVVALAGVHDEGDVFDEARQVFEIVHEAHEFLQVFQAALGLRGFVGLPHGGVARLIKDEFGEFGVAHGVHLAAPAFERGEQAGHGAAGFAG